MLTVVSATKIKRGFVKESSLFLHIGLSITFDLFCGVTKGSAYSLTEDCQCSGRKGCSQTSSGPHSTNRGGDNEGSVFPGGVAASCFRPAGSPQATRNHSHLHFRYLLDGLIQSDLQFSLLYKQYIHTAGYLHQQCSTWELNLLSLCYSFITIIPHCRHLYVEKT